MNKIIWKSEPISPGETLMLYGEFDADAGVFAARLDDKLGLKNTGFIQLQMLSASEQCLKAIIPEEFGKGVYAIFVRGSGEASETLLLNAPIPVWHMGSDGEFANPGDKLRLFGKNLCIDERVKPTVYLSTGEGALPLEIIAYDRYDLTISLPAVLGEGEYSLSISNGFGGSDAVSAGYRFKVKLPSERKTDIFNVMDYGAVGRYGAYPDDSHDDTNAIRAALAAAEENGGGIVYLPRGTYKVSEKIVIPRNVTLRGEKREAVWIYVPGWWYSKDSIDCVFAGDGDFTIEDLSIAAASAKKIIAAPDRPEMYELPWGYPMKIANHPKADNVKLRNLRIQHLRYWPRLGDAGNISMTAEEISGDPRRLENNGPSSIILSGDRLELSGCDIVGCGMAVILHDTRYSIMRDNFIHGGRGAWCYTWWGAYCCVMENNTIEGRDLEAGGGGFSNWGNSGSDLTKIYIARNTTKCLFGGEREGLCFDSSTTPELYPWTGIPDEYTASGMKLTKPHWNNGKLVGLACLIVRGRGIGQLRRITENTETELSLDREWDIQPDNTSVTAVISYRRDVVMYKNHAQDTSTGIEFWGGTYDYIMDSNSEVRTGGSWGRGAQYREGKGEIFLPHYFTQWLNNSLSEGFVYEIGNTRLFGYLGIRGGGCADPTLDAGIPAVGNVFRGNTLTEGMRIYFDGDLSSCNGRDNIIEANSISDTPVAIEIAGDYESTLIRNNLTRGVEKTELQADMKSKSEWISG